ncbi:MAG: hypothetical protein ABI654_12175 [Betaproteobacteria bacterium]
MRIYAIRTARAIWLLPPYFLNPKGVYIRPALEALKKKYRFEKSPYDSPPTSPPSPTADSVRFENGAFENKGKTVAISSFIIHGDGFVVETRSSTSDADAFLEDALKWMAKENDLPDPSTHPFKKLYTSEINFSFDKLPKFFSAKMNSFFKEVSSKVGEEKENPLGFLAWQISADRNNALGQMASFRIDRELNTKSAEGRLYSFATCHTNVHIELLKKLEAEIS